MTLRYWWWHADAQESITARILPTLYSLSQYSSQNNTAEISKSRNTAQWKYFCKQTIHQGQQSCDCKKSMGRFCQWLNWWQSKPCSRGQKGAVSLSCPLWSTAAEARRVRSVFLVHFGPLLRGLVELLLQLLVLHGLLQLRLLAVPAHSREEAIVIQNPPFAIIQNPTAVIIQNPSRCYNTKSTLCYNTKNNNL